MPMRKVPVIRKIKYSESLFLRTFPRTATTRGVISERRVATNGYVHFSSPYKDPDLADQ